MTLYTGMLKELPKRPGVWRDDSWTVIAMRPMGNILLPVNLTGDLDVNRARSAQAMLTNEPK